MRPPRIRRGPALLAAGFLILTGLVFGPCLCNRPAPVEAPSRGLLPVGQLRAVWAHGTSTKTREATDRLIEKAARGHFNCIYWLGFWWGGHAYFESTHVPMSPSVEPGFDPLQYLCEQAHRRGIEVHVRFVNGDNGSAKPGPVFGAHPHWAQRLPSGTRRLWYDFNKPEVRRFQAELMLEVAERYPIDGLQFDFVRYQNPEGCWCDYCQTAFEEATGLAVGGLPEACLPAVFSTRANPLAEPTTARVLAEFGNGTPGITENDYGAGQTVLLNWHADEGPRALTASIIRQAMTGWGAGPGDTVLGIYTQSSASYRAKYGPKTQQILNALGFGVQWIRADELPGRSGPVIGVVPNCYVATADDAEALAGAVRAGGHLLFIDGPLWGIQHRPLADALGLAKEGRFFDGLSALVPKEPSDLFTVDTSRLSVEAAAKLPDLWWQFQAGHITDLVRDVGARARSLPRPVAVSACVFPRLSVARSMVQDWPRWVREGLIDHAVPMAYTLSDARLREYIADWRTVQKDLSRIVPGLMVYQSDANTAPRDSAEVLEQLEICREAGMTGAALFASPQVSEELLEALATGPWAR